MASPSAAQRIEVDEAREPFGTRSASAVMTIPP